MEPRRRADQQLVVVKEEGPSLDQEDPEPPHIKEDLQDWSSGLDQEDPEPPHIKEDLQDRSSGLDQEDPGHPEHLKEEQQLQGLEETKFPFTPVPVKSEDDDDDEEEAQASQLHHMESAEEDCGGPGPARTSDPEPETDDSEDWQETRDLQSGLNLFRVSWRLQVGGHKCDSRDQEPPTSSSAGLLDPDRGGPGPRRNPDPQRRRFSCSECRKSFSTNGTLRKHMRCHTGEKLFSCSVCLKAFTQRGHLQKHTRIHTGEKPLSCSACGKSFSENGNLKKHMRYHTGEKLFRCSVCRKSFSQRGHLQKHTRIHTGEKPFRCSQCGKAFSEGGNLKVHMRIHSGERTAESSRYKQLAVKEEDPGSPHFKEDQQDWSSGLDQEDPEPPHVKEDQLDQEDPEPPHIKEDQRDWSSGQDQEDPDTPHIKEDQQDWSSGLDQEDPEPPHIKEDRRDWSSGLDQEDPEPPHIKEEEGEQLQGLEEADLTKFPLTPVPVKSEDDDDDEEAQSSQLPHMEVDGEDCGGPGPARTSDPEPETDDSEDWKETRDRQSDETFSCSVCRRRFLQKKHLTRHLTRHMTRHTRERRRGHALKPRRSGEDRGGPGPHRGSGSEEPPESLSGSWRYQTQRHESSEDSRGEEPPTSSSDPDGDPGPGPDRKSDPDASVDVAFWTETRKHQSGFTYQRNKKTSSCSEDLKAGPEARTDPDPSGPHRVDNDLRCNTNMKPFSSSTCEDIHTLPTHRESPGGGKPPSCALPAPAAGHVTEEEAFSCSVCHTGHRDSDSLVQHMRIHTRQTQFRCSVCGEEFTWRRVLTKHMEVHKIYSCSVCAQKFTWLWQKKYHKCVGRRSSRLHRRPVETGAEGEPGPETGDSSEPETDDSEDWKETRDPQSASKSLKDS